METKKRQLQLAIENAPQKVREYGLQVAHIAPFVGLRDVNGQVRKSFRVLQDQAWKYPDVGYAKSWNAWAAIVVDVDRPEILNDIIYAGSSLLPNWVVFNKFNGHGHAVYPLKSPVLMHSEAKQAPLQYLADIEKKMIYALDGDPGYSAHLARNPITKDDFGTETLWLRQEPWMLDELNDAVLSHLPAGWKPSRLADLQQGAISRNCDLFHSLMQWAGRNCNRNEDVMLQAELLNTDFLKPLPLSEIRSIAKSVSKYQARWKVRGWHNHSWLKKQKFRSFLGNRAKTQKNTGRNQCIVDDINGGMNKTQIAKKYGLSRMQVYRIIKSVTFPNTG